ncbi:hypothetical protein [Methanobrevibacter sp.]
MNYCNNHVNKDIGRGELSDDEIIERAKLWSAKSDHLTAIKILLIIKLRI